MVVLGCDKAGTEWLPAISEKLNQMGIENRIVYDGAASGCDYTCLLYTSYYNVHLDGTEQTNTGSYRLVNTEVKKNVKYPCFVGGDFNMNVGSEAHNLFISTMDEARIVVPNATSQPFTGTYAVGYPEIQPQSNGDDQGRCV